MADKEIRYVLEGDGDGLVEVLKDVADTAEDADESLSDVADSADKLAGADVGTVADQVSDIGDSAEDAASAADQLASSTEKVADADVKSTSGDVGDLASSLGEAAGEALGLDGAARTALGSLLRMGAEAAGSTGKAGGALSTVGEAAKKLGKDAEGAAGKTQGLFGQIVGAVGVANLAVAGFELIGGAIRSANEALADFAVSGEASQLIRGDGMDAAVQAWKDQQGAIGGAAYALGNFLSLDWESQSENIREDLEAARQEMGDFKLATFEASDSAKTFLDALIAGDAGTRTAQTALSSYITTTLQTSEAQAVLKAAYEGVIDATYRYSQVALAAGGANISREQSHQNLLAALDKERTTVDDMATGQNELTVAQLRTQQAALGYAQSQAQAFTDNLRAQGQNLTAMQEQEVQARVTRDALVKMQSDPAMQSPALQAWITDQITSIDQLQAKGAEGVTLEGKTTGEDAIAGLKTEVNEATGEKVATLRVESRNGPAVVAYLSGLARDYGLATVTVESRNGPAVLAYLATITGAPRLALVNVESRGGPAVLSYLASIAAGARLAIINTESRGGPAVISYLDGIASKNRLALINTESRGGPAVISYLDGIAAKSRTALITVKLEGAGGIAAQLDALARPRTASINVSKTVTETTVPAAASFAAPARSPLSAATRARAYSPRLTPAGAGRAATAAAPAPATIVQQRTYRIEPRVEPMTDPSSVGRAVVRAIRSYEKDNGESWRR